MTPFDAGLGLALLASLLLGTYLYAVKRYFSDYPATVYVFFLNAFGLVWYLPVAAATLDAPPLPAGFGAAGGGVLAVTLGATLVGTLSLFRALATGAVSYVAPISKIIPVFVLPLELAFFGAHLTPLQLGGVAVATLAVYVANYEPGHLVEPVTRAARSRPAQLALLSAAAFGVVDVGKRTLMQEVSLPPQTYVFVLFATLGAAMAPLAAPRLPDGWRGDLHLFAGVGLLVAATNHVVMLAFQRLSASVASPVINTHAVVAVVLGGLLLDESALGVRLAAAGLAVAGVALITLG